MKKYAVLCDLRIMEEFCGANCEYCEGYYHTPYSNVKLSGKMVMPEEWKKKRLVNSVVEYLMPSVPTMSNFFELAEKVIDEINNNFIVDILKISGGEVTLYNRLTDFIDKAHYKFKTIQILTNGIHLTKEDILRYKQMGNITFQISLDGIDKKSNYARTHNGNVTQRVLKNIEDIAQAGIGIEINTVLTKYNTDCFNDFLDFFSPYKKLIIFPRPVRGEPKKILFPSEQQIENFENVVITNYQNYYKILPAKEYLLHVVEYMRIRNNIIDNRCYIPNVIISCNNYGTIEKCPVNNKPQNKNSNILSDSFEPNFVLDENKCIICNNCINQYNIINLYMKDIIPIEELYKIPSFKFENIVRNIKDLKEHLRND